MVPEMADISPRSLASRAAARSGTAAYSVVGLALVIVSWVVSEPQFRTVVQGAVGLLAVVALLVGARRTQRVGTNPWICVAVGIGLWVSGSMVLSFSEIGGGARPYWADAIHFAGYIAIGIGFVVFARVAADVTSRTAMLDACVIAIAAAMVLWVAFVAPELTNSMSVAHRLMLAASPVRDAVLVAILGWIILTPGRRSAALRMMGLALAMVLAADVASGVAHRLDRTWSDDLGLVQTLAFFVLGLAGIYAPRAIRTPSATDVEGTEQISRSIILGVALLIGPLAIITGDLTTTTSEIMIGACSVLLAVGVVARFVNLVHQNQRAHEATATSERRFRLLADSAPVGIFEIGRGMRVTYANPEGCRLLGPDVLGGSTEEMLARVDPSSHPSLRAAIDALEHGERGDAELKLSGGPRDRWVTWQGVPVKVGGPHLPMAFASTLDITQLKQAEAALARQATHDPLTGLPNRRLLFEALIRGLATLGRGHRTGTVALMFIDLDQFKMVNDVLGHDAGDALLKTAAARLRNAVRDHDIVARFGGDEFVVLLEHVSDRGELHEVAQRILCALDVPIHVGGTEAKVGASVGIATATGPDDDPDALVRNADAAMYRAKERGRGRYEFFRPDSTEKAHRML